MQPTNPQIQHTMSAPRWSVPSATVEGTDYQITVDDNGERVCSCKANDYPKTRGMCWHLKAVSAGLVKPRVRVSQRPARREYSQATINTIAMLDICHGDHLHPLRR